MDDTGVRFGLLWGEAHLAVRAYVHGLVGDPIATDDLVQDIALAAFRSFASYDRQRSFTGWAIGVARHFVHRHWSASAKRRLVVHDLALVAELAEIAAEQDDAAADEREALRACLEAVAGRSWEVVRLHYVEGHSTLEVAERLQLAAGHVRVLLHRIRAALRSCIERRLAGAGRG